MHFKAWKREFKARIIHFSGGWWKFSRPYKVCDSLEFILFIISRLWIKMFTRITFISLLACASLLVVSSALYDESYDDFEDEYSEDPETDEIDSLLSKLEEKYSQSSKKKLRPEAKKIKHLEAQQKAEKKLSPDFQPNCKRWHLCWHSEIPITLMFVKGNA